MSITPVKKEERDPAMDAAVRYTRANDRYKVLSQCLEIFLTDKRRFSVNESAQSAKIGYEKAFDEAEHNALIVRQMMVEARTDAEKALQELGKRIG